MPNRKSSSSGGGKEPPSYSEVTSSTENTERRRQQLERQISAGQIRLRSGSQGHKPLKNEDTDLDDEHEPIEVLKAYCLSC